MNKLSKEKQSQLILTTILVLCVLSGLWFGLIKYQKRHLTILQDQRAAAEKTLERVERTCSNASVIATQLLEVRSKVEVLETNMASGDLYAWVIETIRQFKTPYKVEIPQFSQIDGPKDCTLLPGFPYKQASLTVGGTAFYHDLGRFISDLENQFPYFRVVNLNLEPSSGTGADAEKLSFKMEIVVLVKPGAI
jgi:hypothetical protein